MSHFPEIKAEGELRGRRLWARLGLIWGIWTLVGLFFTSQIYFTYIYTERPVPLSKALFSQLTTAYLGALITPLVLWLAGRFRIERQHWLRSLLIHVFASAAMAIILSAVHYSIMVLYYKGAGALSLSDLLRNALYSLNTEMLIYWFIVLMNHAFNFYNRYRSGELRASQLETQLTQAQLQALKMQLHPHFFFNTLHSISALLNKDTEAARTMIARLGDFLRITLENSGTQEVTLEQELEFLRCYLEIEQVRFHDRLTTRMNIEPQTLKMKVPNLILQPIVENAIRHGIAPQSTPGQIEVQSERLNGMLRLQVRDNGPGLPLSGNSSNPFRDGLGLTNTRARLKKIYGAAHHFELANEPGGGVVVTIEIPAKVKGEQG